MEIKIGPYTISQRTEYSKIIVFDEVNKINVSQDDEEFAKELIDIYKKQTKSPEKYFEIGDDIITGINEDIDEDYIQFLFVPEGITTLDDFALSGVDFECISLPSTLTKINENALYSCEAVEYLDIPDSVQIILSNAFEDCTSLQKIKLPSSIRRLDDGLFYGCTNLSEIVIPDTVEEIGGFVFGECSSLKSIKLPPNLKIIDTSTFDSCDDLKEVVFQDKIEKIKNCAFCDCIALEELTLPDSIKEIERKAFANCFDLETIKLPKDITYLARELFSGCYSLSNLTLPDNIKLFEESIFRDTKELECINIPKELDSIKGCPFRYSSVNTLIFNYDLNNFAVLSELDYLYDLVTKSNIKKLVISNSVKTIVPDAFKYSGKQITTIDYLGTKKEFNKFKKNNKGLFDVLPNISNITFKEEEIENDFIRSEER